MSVGEGPSSGDTVTVPSPLPQLLLVLLLGEPGSLVSPMYQEQGVGALISSAPAPLRSVSHPTVHQFTQRPGRKVVEVDLGLFPLSGTQAWPPSVRYCPLTVRMDSWVDFLEGAMFIGTWGPSEWPLDGYLFQDGRGVESGRHAQPFLLPVIRSSAKNAESFQAALCWSSKW